MKRNLLLILRALTGVSIMIALFWYYDFGQTVRLVLTLSGGSLLVAIGWFVLNTAISIGKWQLSLPIHVRFATIARSYVTSYFYSLLPTGQAGAELGKIAMLSSRASLSSLATSIAFDKLTSVLALCLVGTFAWLFAPVELWMGLLVATGVLGCALAIVFAPTLRNLVQRWPLRLCLPVKFRIAVEDFLCVLSSLTRRRDVVAKSLFLGLASQLCLVGTYQALASALGVNLPIADLALFVVVANIATLLPISFGGIGIREASFVGLLTSAHISGDKALALSLSVFAVFLLGAAAGGAIELYQILRAMRHEPQDT
jgi:uncharacterized membrane protein YbhN (UPF0104 family)